MIAADSPTVVESGRSNHPRTSAISPMTSIALAIRNREFGRLDIEAVSASRELPHQNRRSEPNFNSSPWLAKVEGFE
jgi:hypothetical protein